MSADSDLIKLYSDRILALAADMSATTPLQDPHISVKKRSPLCGSVVTVDIKVKAGKVTDYAQDVKACALGQAAASVVGRSIIGCDRAQIEKAR
ncbi:MAG: iron-sulfur cluster assembly scaffold protein, partial [Paracoccaceae bacterium]